MFHGHRAAVSSVLLLAAEAVNTTNFVSAQGIHFVLQGKSYRFTGTNCYYLSYKDRFMVDDVLESAASQGFQVVRTWAFIDIGHKNGSGSVDSNSPIKDGHYFQYWDGTRPAYNDTNMQGLDYVIAKAHSLGLRMLLTLTNNWADFGGMDQYVMWKSFSADTNANLHHDDFFSDPVIKGWYKDYARHVIMRRNTVTGLIYAEDPAIFAWELANEPRCSGTGTFAQSRHCVLNYAVYGVDPVAAKTTAWAHEMSQYIKSLDPHHMVAMGDEGFTCNRYQVCHDATCDCYHGVDSNNITKLPNIDFMSLHLYPGQWGKQVHWATEYIVNHTRTSHALGKPVVLGEYGWKNNQPNIYSTWTQAIESSDMNGDLFWMISGRSNDAGAPGWVRNYDGYAVYCPQNKSFIGQPPPGDNGTCPVLAAHAKRMEHDSVPIPPSITLPPLPIPSTASAGCTDSSLNQWYPCGQQTALGKCTAGWPFPFVLTMCLSTYF